MEICDSEGEGRGEDLSFDREDIELTVDGKQYDGILQWGSLSLFEQSDSSHDIRTYVSRYSPMYSGYEKERSELKNIKSVKMA